MANGNVRIVRTTRTWRNELISTGKGLGWGHVLLTEVFLKSVEPPYFVERCKDGLFFCKKEGESTKKLDKIESVVECAFLEELPFCVLPYQDGHWIVEVGDGTAERICKIDGMYLVKEHISPESRDFYIYC